MNIHIKATVRNTYTDALTAALAVNGGTIELRDGTQPATPETTATGTLGATLTLNATAFGASAAGIATAGAITSGTGVANITPTWFRMKNSGGTAVLDGSAGTASTDLILAAANIAIGATISCSSLTLGTAA